MRTFSNAILVDTTGRLLLQQRDDKPGILHRGKIGLFGGHREDGESELECIVREVREEIRYWIPPERFEHLGTYEGFDPDVPEGVQMALFVAHNVPMEELSVTEGSLFITDLEEIDAISSRLAPSAAWSLEVFLTSRTNRQA